MKLTRIRTNSGSTYYFDHEESELKRVTQPDPRRTDIGADGRWIPFISATYELGKPAYIHFRHRPDPLRTSPVIEIKELDADNQKSLVP